MEIGLAKLIDFGPLQILVATRPAMMGWAISV